MPDLSTLTDKQLDLLEKYHTQGMGGLSDSELDELEGLHSDKGPTPLDTAKSYGKTMGTEAAKVIPQMLGGAISGAVSLGRTDSPAAALEAGKARPRNTMLNWLQGQGNLADVFKYDMPPGKEGPDISAPSPSFLTDKAGKAIGGWHEPASEGERIAGAGTAGVVGGLLTGPGGLISRAGTYGALPGAVSEGVRHLTEGVTAPSWLPFVGGKDISPAASAVAGMVAPTMGARAVTPLPVGDAARRAATGTLNREGIRTTAGQDTGRKWLMEHEAREFPGRNDQQARQFTTAVTDHLGVPTEEATIGQGGYIPTVGRDIRANMDAISHRNNINLGVMSMPERMGVLADLEDIARNNPQHVNHILGTVRQNTGWTPNMVGAPSGAAGDSQRLWRTLFPAARTMRGEDYQRLRSQFFSTATSLASDNPTRAQAYRDMAGTLDRAMGHSIARQNPNDITAFQDARQLLENNMIVERARNKTGATDQIDPNKLESAARDVVGDRRYNRGDTPYQPLATAAQKAMPLLKGHEGDWAHTGLGMAALGGIAGPAAALTALAMGHGLKGAEAAFLPGLFGGPAAAAVPAYLGHKLTTTLPGQTYLRNQLLPATAANRGQRMTNALFQSYLAGQRGKNE